MNVGVLGDSGVSDLPVKPMISAPLGAPHRLGKGMVAKADTGSIETTGTMRQTERENQRESSTSRERHCGFSSHGHIISLRGSFFPSVLL